MTVVTCNGLSGGNVYGDAQNWILAIVTRTASPTKVILTAPILYFLTVHCMSWHAVGCQIRIALWTGADFMNWIRGGSLCADSRWMIEWFSIAFSLCRNQFCALVLEQNMFCLNVVSIQLQNRKNTFLQGTVPCASNFYVIKFVILNKQKRMCWIKWNLN